MKETRELWADQIPHFFKGCYSGCQRKTIFGAFFLGKRGVSRMDDKHHHAEDDNKSVVFSYAPVRSAEKHTAPQSYVLSGSSFDGVPIVLHLPCHETIYFVSHLTKHINKRGRGRGGLLPFVNACVLLK